MTEWKKVRLGDLCKNVYSGGTPKKSITEYYDGSIFWLNTKEINFNRIYETEKTISEKGLANSSAKYIPENTVVVAMYGTNAGKVAIAKNEMTTNQACCNLIIDELTTIVDENKINLTYSSKSVWTYFFPTHQCPGSCC